MTQSKYAAKIKPRPTGCSMDLALSCGTCVNMMWHECVDMNPMLFWQNIVHHFHPLCVFFFFFWKIWDLSQPNELPHRERERERELCLCMGNVEQTKIDFSKWLICPSAKDYCGYYIIIFQHVTNIYSLIGFSLSGSFSLVSF